MLNQTVKILFGLEVLIAVMMKRFIEIQPTFWRFMSYPSSGSKNKPSERPAEESGKLGETLALSKPGIFCDSATVLLQAHSGSRCSVA
jgi:hypothetical protein